jgi:hypothetical protein
MTHVIDGRAGRAERSHSSQGGHEWLTAEELGKHLNMSANAVKDILVEAGHKCREAKKPKEEALRIGLAREFRHHGRKIFKWNKRAVIPEIQDYLAKAT